MGTTAEKLTYLNGTKRLLRRRLNSLGADITLETKFRDYLLWLDRFYDAASSAVNFEILGETKLKAINSSTNLLPFYSGEIVENGLTVRVSDGGKISINGTATSTIYFRLTNGLEYSYEDPYQSSSESYRWRQEKICDIENYGTFEMFRGGGSFTAPAPAVGQRTLSAVAFTHKNSSTADSLDNQLSSSGNEYKCTRRNVSQYDKELNSVVLVIPAGSSFTNYWCYIQFEDLTETPSTATYSPNTDAAPPSPSNPKEIINKKGDITYTASDGTTFPVSLGDIKEEGLQGEEEINLCGNPDPNGKPDRVYYKNGKFYLEKWIIYNTYIGVDEGWYYDSTNEVYKSRLSIVNVDSHYAISNYFENVPNPNIVDSSTAGANLNNGQFAITVFDGDNTTDFFIKYTDLNESDSSATALKNWLSTHNTIIQYSMEEEEVLFETMEITKEEYPRLYGQLQAIIDYETTKIIEKKIF